jgi:hypothetical protein
MRVATSPPPSSDFNRFLPRFESFVLCLNLCHRGNNVWSEVNGHLSWQFDHESRPFIEKP